MARLGSSARMALAALGAVLVFGSPAAAMTFERVAGAGECAERTCILASGDIDANDAREFADFLKRQQIRPGALLILNSAGGDVVEALAIGGSVRKAALSTHVGAYDHASGELKSGGVCASACAYLFLGGVSRTVGKGAKLGVHQLYARTGEVNISDGQVLMGMIAAHINRHGGSIEVLISALRTPPDSMHWMSPAELNRFGMVTGELTRLPGHDAATSG